jgi:hypothetical protein
MKKFAIVFRFTDRDATSREFRLDAEGSSLPVAVERFQFLLAVSTTSLDLTPIWALYLFESFISSIRQLVRALGR